MILCISHSYLRRCSSLVFAVIFIQKYFCAKRASKIIVLPKEMWLSFSIGTFLTNYDVINWKLLTKVMYSIVGKWTIWDQNNPLETTVFIILVTHGRKDRCGLYLLVKPTHSGFALWHFFISNKLVMSPISKWYH